MTEVHVQYIPLDRGAPVVLVETNGRAHAALDRSRRKTAEAYLEILLMARYGPNGWNIVPSAG